MPGKHTYPRAMATGQAKEEKKGRELSESKQKRKDNRKENRESRAADRQANRNSRKAERQANRKKRLTAKAKVVRARAEANIDKIGARREAGQTARMETRQSRVAAQKDRYNRIQERIDKNTPEAYGPYQMHPGAHSEVNPGNFKGSEIKKYASFMYNPTLTDMSGDDQVTKKDLLIARNVPGFEKGMDKKAQMHYGKPHMGHK